MAVVISRQSRAVIKIKLPPRCDDDGQQTTRPERHLVGLSILRNQSATTVLVHSSSPSHGPARPPTTPSTLIHKITTTRQSICSFTKILPYNNMTDESLRAAYAVTSMLFWMSSSKASESVHSYTATHPFFSCSPNTVPHCVAKLGDERTLFCCVLLSVYL